MKTKFYTQSEEIRTIILLVVLSFTLFFSAKAQNLPTQQSHSSFTTNKRGNTDIADDADFNETAINGQLAMEIRPWMTNGAYWEPFKEPEDEKLLNMLSKYMSKGLYWNTDDNLKNTKQESDVQPVADAQNE